MKVTRTHKAFRRGFTLLEITAALAVLLFASTVAAQLAFWVIQEISHGRASQTAQEFAANVLESARAQSWDDLGPSWARAQHLPATLQEKNWQLQITVAPEPKNRLVKRVTVDIERAEEHGRKGVAVYLVGLFSARGGPADGGKL